MSRSFRTFLLILAVFGLSWGAASAQTGSEKIGTGVRTSIVTENKTQVVIALEEPQPVLKDGATLKAMNRNVQRVQEDVLSEVSQSEFRVTRLYDSVPAVVGTVTSEAVLDRLADHPKVRRIDLDEGEARGSLSRSVQTIRADRWHDQDATGTGVVVAVLDSGIDTDHDDLADDLIHEACFLNFIEGGQCPIGTARQIGEGAAEDDYGHGTYVTGIITSDGVRAPRGVAPDAEIVAIKVLNSNGRSSSFSDILDALDYLINHPELGVQVVNMSLGTDTQFSTDCDSTTSWNMSGASAIRTLRAQGTLPVASSMNEGSDSEMASPACLSGVVSVGATDPNDNVTRFTNSNRFLDLVAPGVNIQTSALGNTTTRWFSGTSAAAPHAAGCAALLLDAGTHTAPDEIEASLKRSPVRVIDPKNGLTFPRLDCYTARQLVTIEGIQATLSSVDEQDAPTRQYSLRWQTTFERNSEGFIVERKSGPLTPETRWAEEGWEQVRFVETKASEGRSSDTLRYQYDGAVPTPGQYAFRLRHVTTDAPDKGLIETATTLHIPIGSSFSLGGPQPNPSRGTAEVELVVEETQNVAIALYDALGRQVQILYNDQLDARRPLFLRTAESNLAGGTYFLQVKGEEFVETRKMMVVK